MNIDLLRYNSEAWDRESARGNQWTIPVSGDVIAAARRGEYGIYLTPEHTVPHEWIGPVAGRNVLCLASGGGQQAPVFAAMGANVTLLDNSAAQLEADRSVCLREGLSVRMEQGDMRDLSRFPDGSFDLIFHPVSNCFVDDVHAVWRECYRVLGDGGVLLAGFSNPVLYLFDWERWEKDGERVIRYSIPYSDLASLPAGELEARIARGEPLEFSHTLGDLIGGQLAAGFRLTGFYEDRGIGGLLDEYLPVFISTRAVKN